MVNSATCRLGAEYTLIQDTPASSIMPSDCAAANNVINFWNDLATTAERPLRNDHCALLPTLPLNLVQLSFRA